MKNIKKIYKYFFVLFVLIACEEDLRNTSFVDSINPPSNVSATYDITQDNTGLVTITPSADGASGFMIYFGDTTPDPVELKVGENVQHTYAEGTYDVKVVAMNIKGDTTEAIQQLVVSFKAPQNLVVTIENDPAISKKVNITANADFAAMFEFDSGETGVTQPVATGNIGNTISYQYANPGKYNVKVTAKGAAIATTEYAVEFEVTEILAPIASAPTPPTRSASDVVSINTEAYTNINADLLPDWGQSQFGSSFMEFDLNGDKMLQYVNLSYQGIAFDNDIQDVSSMEFIHLDVWTPNLTKMEISIINTSDEKPVWRDLTLNEWTSIDIPLKEFTDQGLTLDQVRQLKFVSEQPWPRESIVFVDNIYFYKKSAASTFDDGLLSNGDFQAGSDSWIVGVDDNSPAPIKTESGNTFYHVQVPNAGNPWEVNLSQKREIVDGNTYTLTFEAWSNTNRNIIAGIGLSADPWSSDTKSVAITPAKTTYSVTVKADGWGAANARILFDSGAEIGDVNIDNVSLLVGNGNLLKNGNFEDGSAPWIIGVDDNSSAPVVNTNGNNHYFVDVTTAGNPWEVNVSQKVEIIDGETYILTFDAWSDVNRSIVSGIGLSADPWSSETQSVDLTTTRTTYTLTLKADGWGAANARVLFDSGAAVGKVYIDNVSLSKN